jgi:hypothetical protein
MVCKKRKDRGPGDDEVHWRFWLASAATSRLLSLQTCKGKNCALDSVMGQITSENWWSRPSDSKICKLWIEQITPYHLYTNLRIPNPYHPKSEILTLRWWRRRKDSSTPKSFTSTSRQLEDAPSQFYCFWPRCTRLSTLVLLLVLDAHLANAYSFRPTGIFCWEELNPKPLKGWEHWKTLGSMLGTWWEQSRNFMGTHCEPKKLSNIPPSPQKKKKKTWGVHCTWSLGVVSCFRPSLYKQGFYSISVQNAHKYARFKE